MALTDRSIITLNEAKDFLGINTAEDDVDTFLETLIDLASGSIEEGISDSSSGSIGTQKVATQDTELILDGNGGAKLSLPCSILRLAGSGDAEKLANLQYRDEADEAWTDLTDDMDFVRILPSPTNQIELLGSEYFPVGRGNIRIEFVSGMDPVPAKLRLLCLEMVSEYYKNSGKGFGTQGLQSVGLSGTAGENKTLKDNAQKWESVLKQYRVRRATINSLDI